MRFPTLGLTLLLGCSTRVDAASPLSPEAPVAPAAPFSCANAAAALGHPTATVTLCVEQPVLKGVYRVGLSGGDLPGPVARVIALRDGQPIAERGGAAAAAFLRAAHVWDLRGLAPEELTTLLFALEAWPKGFSFATASTSFAGAPVPVTTQPFTFTLITSKESYERGGRAGGGGVTHRYAVRATLTGGPDTKFGWVVEMGDGKGPWNEIAREMWEE
jgi:hypothetical protein